jgi:hypothetical protein
MAEEQRPSSEERMKAAHEELRKAAMAAAQQWAHASYLIRDLASAADEAELDESHPQIAERIGELRYMFKDQEIIEDSDTDEAAGA